MSSLCYSARQYGKDVVLGFVHMGIQQFSSHASEAWDGKSNTSTVSVCVCVCVCVCGRGTRPFKEISVSEEIAWSLGVSVETVTTHWYNEPYSTGGQTAHSGWRETAPRWLKTTTMTSTSLW